MERPAHLDRPFLTRLGIRNYKSIGGCDLELQPLTVIAGRNGAGKSNLLDALRFVADALRSSLEWALQVRGGAASVRRRSTGHPRNLAVDLRLSLPGWHTARYGFELAVPGPGFTVLRERLEVRDKAGAAVARFDRRGGELASAAEAVMPPIVADRLYLPAAAGLPAFRSAWDTLTAMSFYRFDPEAMRPPRPPDPAPRLRPDGANLAAVVGRLAAERPEALTRIGERLAAIVPGIRAVERVAVGPAEALRFRQEIEGAEHPWKLWATEVSEGTLRALAALVAVAQGAGSEEDRRSAPPLVGLTEPETTLHPAATGPLVEALREATEHTQVLVTSHGSDLLDRLDPQHDGLLAAVARGGTTRVAPVDAGNRDALRDHITRAGELLRTDRLLPDEADLERQEQMELFTDGADDEDD